MTDEQIMRRYEAEERRWEKFRTDPVYADRRRAQWREAQSRRKQRLREMRLERHVA